MPGCGEVKNVYEIDGSASEVSSGSSPVVMCVDVFGLIIRIRMREGGSLVDVGGGVVADMVTW